jgi:hypothetical protein
MTDAQVIRFQFNWEHFGSTVWTGESAANTLHCGAGLEISQPAVATGPWTLPSFSIDDTSSTYSHTASGQAYSIARGWTFGGTTADTDNLYNAFLDAWQTYWAATNAWMPPSVRLRDIRLYPIGPAGSSVSLAPTIMAPSTSMPGTATGQSSPDMAIVISLYSALHTKRGRGRWYFGPIKQQALNTTTGLIDNTLTGGLSAAMADFLTDLRDCQTGTLSLGVRVLTPVILHRATPYNSSCVIQTVRVGDEIDVQERRTKGRNESYVDTAVT